LRLRQGAQLWDSLWTIALTGAVMRQRDVAYEYRYPLCDLRLVELMTALPWERIARPGTDRWLFRTAMADRLPERILRRRSKGIPSNPIVDGLARSATWTELLTDDPLIAHRGLVDRDRWRLAVKRARVGHLEADRFFIAAATLEAWLRQLAERRVVTRAAALV
jgi:asparagine synthetase B (glutamine-hydrolysing)